MYKKISIARLLFGLYFGRLNGFENLLTLLRLVLAGILGGFLENYSEGNTYAKCIISKPTLPFLQGKQEDIKVSDTYIIILWKVNIEQF